ncbi:SPG4 (YMR107W) [Zygosaccharomyces parabailii]|nr:SPG4 (YMR107W) [Zygosaccharomyces parabailii]CDH10226.1 probable Stationary phase protein 4 [Zygosaccharomyces bailii ISA1307]
MVSFWDSFEVYNRKKHSSNPSMSGGNHSNVGDSKTMYMYAHERQEKRRDSDTSTSSASPVLMGEEGSPQMVDVSKLSQNEFKQLYERTRKGEPNNRVNF